MSAPAQILPLRPYQRAAVDAAHGAWGRGMRRPAEVLFTGAGKTVIFAHLGVEWLSQNPGRRVLVLAHTTELVDQAIAKFRSVAPGLRVGRVQADVNETLARIIVASVATLRSDRRRRMLRDVGLIIVDECHHAVATTYREILSHYGALGPADWTAEGTRRAVAIGFTATMTRADDLSLGDIWQDIVHTESITDGISGGYLVRPRGIHVHVDDLDLSQVRTARGDYREGDLGEAIENSLAPKAIARAIAEHADTRKILLFAPTVHSAEVIAEALRAAGRSVGLVHGAMGAGVRRDALDDFRAGRTQVLANCMVLTEGFDEPAADCAVIARPTKSQGLYIQIAGRVLRPYPGKTDALLLDVVGASLKHTLVSALDLFGVGKPKTESDQTDEDPDDLDEGQQDARKSLFGGMDGDLIATEVDLFTGSPMAWLRTRAGVFFLAAGERYIAIVPGQQPGTYDVSAMHSTQLRTGRWIVQGVEDLAYAMAWAEADVTPVEKMTASKARAWRAKPPSDKQRAKAAGLRINVPDGARSGEVSAMITLALASKRIDPYLPDYMKASRR